MNTAIATITVVTLAGTSAALFLFGVNLLYLTWRATRLRPHEPRHTARGAEPRVCVQIPIYNERYVAERVLDAVCELDWPGDRLEVQVLDDSDDETVSIVARRVGHWRRKGVDCTHVRRPSRSGYKAGALAHGLTLTDAPFIAIFDADFVPPSDFLRRMLTAFDDPAVGFAQARWGHLDEGYSWFTRLQALAIDFHFLVEQAVRSAHGYFTNFTGTAGVWRRVAIVESGGWSAATLTEDLDLSYRAQLRGWRAAYLEDLVVPEELPVSIDAYRRQQSRWATGSFQSAFRLLVPVVRSSNPIAVKFQAAAHLLAYGVGPVMLLQLACYPLLVLGTARHAFPLAYSDAALLLVPIGISPWVGFMVAQTRRGRPWWSGAHSVLCQLVGAGMSLNTTIALVRATRRGGEFVRTPKHRIVERGQEWRDQAYVKVGDPRAVVETVLGIAAISITPLAVSMGQWLVAVYSTMFGLGFLTVAALSAVDFLEVVTLRNLGRNALGRVRASAPVLALFAICGVLLMVAAQMAEPFEDGYGHWLIAANLASTGQLHDPLFGMEDTWLPGYHVLAAAVLKVFGLWQLGALKAMSGMFGLATLACVYALAPNRRQGRFAVALLALNPVFLFTSGSAVVEPLLTALLAGAGLAAVKGRAKLAALLALLACITSTKAWIWIVAVAAFAAFEILRGHVPARRRWPAASGVPANSRRSLGVRGAFAVAVPSLALLVFLQFGFAPATHSITRGSIEVMSATTRGSLPAGAFGRLTELAGTFGLAALPLFALGIVGLATTVRQKATPVLRFVYAPALVYLAAVFALVGIGAYTGSHRYLYPALPAMALLAASALDHHAAVIRVATVAAAGLLTVAFLPVFAGFAADNAGLMAAGRVVSGNPGLLITDSPVVAYFSRKPLTEITGSQVLPPERNQAIAWLGAHKANDLVLENISYYRAAQIFPDLASGNAKGPFQPLGEQAQYQVAGGKSVFAYRLGTELQTQPIYPGVSACIEAIAGEGKTAPLAKGLVLEVGGTDVSGEGMGFGVPIVSYPDGWVYSRTAATVDLSTAGKTTWTRAFQLDEIGGDKAHNYSFVPIPSRGEVDVTYTIDGKGIDIAVHPVWLVPGHAQVGILNEQSAAFDDFASDRSPSYIGTAFGNWIPVDGAWARLRSASLKVEWSVPAIRGAVLHGGRELNRPDFDWAGLDYIFPASFAGTSYRITVQEAR